MTPFYRRESEVRGATSAWLRPPGCSAGDWALNLLRGLPGAQQLLGRVPEEAGLCDGGVQAVTPQEGARPAGPSRGVWLILGLPWYSQAAGAVGSETVSLWTRPWEKAAADLDGRGHAGPRKLVGKDRVGVIRRAGQAGGRRACSAAMKKGRLPVF